MNILKIYFLVFLDILLDTLVVHIVIAFNKHTEIHLNGRKYQIYSKILETPTWQFICSLLRIKNIL